MEEKRKELWNYITSNLLNYISNLEDYNEKELIIMKLNLLSNLNIMLESEEKFNDVISILRDNQNTKRFM